MSSKSWDTAGFAAWAGQEASIKVLCVRQFQNKISESVYTLIKEQIKRFEFGGYDIQANKIKHSVTGSEFVFYGIARNIDEIKSFEGADVLWIEEAHNLTKSQWEILEPTIRKAGSQVWITFNPKYMNDFVYQRFVLNPPPNTIIRKINYDENPFLSDTALGVVNAAKNEDEDDYQHIYLGVPLTDDDDAVIKRSWIESCIDAHLLLDIDMSGACTVGYDVADSGADKNSTTRMDGSICVSSTEWKAGEDELRESALRAMNEAMQFGGFLGYDSIGVGAHTGSTLKDEGYTQYGKFNAGGAVQNPEKLYAPKITNKEKFENLKAQAWQDVADRMRNTYNAINKGMVFEASDLISIASDIDGIEQLKGELATPRKRYSKRGLDMIETKDELKKRDIASPNRADSFIIAACPHLIKRSIGRLRGMDDY